MKCIKRKVIKTLSKKTQIENIETIEYNKDGNILNHISDRIFFEYKYDNLGRKIYHASNGYKEYYKYEKNKIHFSNSEKLSWEKTLDVNGNEISYKEKNNIGWFFKIFLNRKFQGLSWKKEYDERNNEIYYEDNLKNKLWQKYNLHNDLIYKSDKKSLNISYKHIYDEKGNKIYFESSDGSIWEKRYDKKNNLVYEKNIDKIITEYIYDDNSNLTTIIRSNNNITNFVYDKYGKLIAENSPEAKISYEYDDKNKLLAITTIGAFSNEKIFNEEGDVIYIETDEIIVRYSYIYY